MEKMFKKTKSLLLAFVAVLTIGLCSMTAKAGNSFTTAEQVAMGQTITMDFQTDNVEHYYKFTTDGALGYYSINFGKISGDTKYIKIFEGPDESYSKVVDDYRGSNGNETYVKALKANHTYYIKCTSYNGGGQSRFTITKINDDYANTLPQGTRLTLGSTITGSIEVSDKGECDTFMFTTTGNHSFYEIDLSSTGNNTVNAYIYEGPDESYNNSHMSASSGNTGTVIKRLEKNKTYYVRIGGYWDDATHYKFVVKEIRDDIGDDFPEATKLKNKKTKTGKIQIEDDVDFFSFKTDKKKTAYQLYFKNKSQSGMYITVYSNNDIASAINQVKNYYISGATAKTFWLKLKKNRTYYVKVRGNDNCSYNIQFKDSRTAIKTAYPSSFKIRGYRGWSYNYTYLSWNHKGAYTGYEIHRSTSPKSGFKKIKRVKDTSYYYDKSVKRGVTYYYKMRYYIKDNGKYYYGKWTKTKKVKIK